MSPELAIPEQFGQTQTNIPEDTRIYSGNIPWPVPVVYSVQNPPQKKDSSTNNKRTSLGLVPDIRYLQIPWSWGLIFWQPHGGRRRETLLWPKAKGDGERTPESCF